MGFEGIVSKRKDKAYWSGPGKHWIKVKNGQNQTADSQNHDQCKRWGQNTAYFFSIQTASQ
jgi:ATP-dependent DNA ligase